MRSKVGCSMFLVSLCLLLDGYSSRGRPWPLRPPGYLAGPGSLFLRLAPGPSGLSARRDSGLPDGYVASPFLPNLSISPGPEGSVVSDTLSSASFEGVAGGSKTGRTIEKQLRGFTPKWRRLFCDRWLRFVIAVGHVICPRTSPLVQPVSRHIGLGLLVSRSCFAWP